MIGIRIVKLRELTKAIKAIITEEFYDIYVLVDKMRKILNNQQVQIVNLP